MNTQTVDLTLTNKLCANRYAAQFCDDDVGQDPGSIDPIAGRTATAPVEAFTFWTRRSEPIVVRRVLPDDREQISAMLRGLSARTLERRYLTPQPMTAARAEHEAQRMAQGQSQDHITLIGSAQGEHRPAIIAVAELVRDGQQSALGEVAIVVQDGLQGAGIGTVLLRCLARMALAAGFLTLQAYMLPENRAMQEVVRKLGMPYTTAYQAGDLEMRVQLAPFGATAP